MSRIRFGQPVEPCANPDKWALLDRLTLAAEAYGLNHRSLGVLRALLSFYPQRTVPSVPGSAVVWPSNRALCDRLNGMPESTLRRHLGALVSAGVLRRQDSANRKRFARFGGLAFGFDLSPLAAEAEALDRAARAAEEERARVAALRARLAALRVTLLDQGLPEDHPDLSETARMLRRKLSSAMLSDALAHLETLVENPREIASATAEMSAPDSENERHIQKTDESDSVEKDEDRAVSLADLTAHCKEYRSYFGADLTNWRDAVQVADRLFPMLGIDRQTYAQSQERMGVFGTTIALLCMLEKLSDIRNPGGYLRALGQRAVAGRLNLRGMVRGLRQAPIVS